MISATNNNAQVVYISCGPGNVTEIDEIFTAMPRPTEMFTTVSDVTSEEPTQIVSSTTQPAPTPLESEENNNTSARLNYVIIGTVCAIVIVCLVIVIVAVVVWARKRRNSKEDNKGSIIRHLMKDRTLSSSHLTYERNSFSPEDPSNGVGFVTYDYDGIMVDNGKKSEKGSEAGTKERGPSVRFSTAVDQIQREPEKSDEAQIADVQVTVDPKSEVFMF